MLGDAAAAHSKPVLETCNGALSSNDAEKLANCFYNEQAYWCDTVVLTSHLQTIEKPHVVAEGEVRGMWKRHLRMEK